MGRVNQMPPAPRLQRMRTAWSRSNRRMILCDAVRGRLSIDSDRGDLEQWIQVLADRLLADGLRSMPVARSTIGLQARQRSTTGSGRRPAAPRRPPPFRECRHQVQHALDLDRADLDAAQVHRVVDAAQRAVISARQPLHGIAVAAERFAAGSRWAYRRNRPPDDRGATAAVDMPIVGGTKNTSPASDVCLRLRRSAPARRRTTAWRTPPARWAGPSCCRCIRRPARCRRNTR